MRLIDADSLIEDLEFLAKHEDSFRQSVILGVVHVIKSRIEIDSMKDCKILEAMKAQVSIDDIFMQQIYYYSAG